MIPASQFLWTTKTDLGFKRFQATGWTIQASQSKLLNYKEYNSLLLSFYKLARYITNNICE
jgi:hypothetical protein